MKIAGNEQMPDSFAVEEGPDLPFGTVMKAVEGEPHRALTSAILNGDVEAVKAFLKEPPSGFDFNAQSYRGLNSRVPLLHLAITAENAHRIEILRLLLDDPRIDLTTVPPDNVTSLGVKHPSALIEARQYHAWRGRPDTAQVVKLVEDKLNQQLRAALLKEDRKQAIALIKAGADGHAGLYGLKDQKEDTSILQYAITLGFEDVVDAILEATPEKDRDALITKRWAGDNSALHVAAAAGEATIYDKLRRQSNGLLRHDDDASSENASGITPAEFLAHSRKRGLPLLSFAAFAGAGALTVPVLLGALAAVSLTVIGTALYRHLHEPDTALPASPIPSPTETGGDVVDWTPTVETPEDLPVYGPPRAPIYRVPNEILLLIRDNLWGQDPYETWQAVNNFSNSHPAFYGWLRADRRAWPNFQRLQGAVRAARSLWDRVFPRGSTEVPDPPDLAYLVQTFNLVPQARRNALLDNVVDLDYAGDRAAALVDLMPLWSLLNDGQRRWIASESAILGRDAGGRAARMEPLIRLLPWLGDLDERREDQRTPLYRHSPDSSITRILDIMVRNGNFRNMEFAFPHMDELQQRTVANAALRSYDIRGVQAVARGLQHMPEHVRNDVINLLLDTFRNGQHNGLRPFALIALGGALPYLEGIDQDEVVTAIGWLPAEDARHALNEAWSSLGGLHQFADLNDPRTRLVRQALNIGDALFQISALERAGHGFEHMTHEERDQVIEAIRSAVDNARQQQGVDVNAVMRTQIRALAGMVTGIRHLDQNQRSQVIDTMVGLRDDSRFTDLLVEIRPVLGNLTTEEIQRLLERANRITDERHKARGLAALLATEYPTSVPAPIQPRGLPDDPAGDKPHLLTSPEATAKDYEDGLNTLAARIGGRMNFDEMTMPSLLDRSIAPLFRNLVIYALNHNGLKFKAGETVDEKVMYEAFDKVTTALRTRVWNVLREDTDKANKSATIFNIYWDDKKGSDETDRLVRQTWREWLDTSKLKAAPAKSPAPPKPEEPAIPEPPKIRADEYDGKLNALVSKIYEGTAKYRTKESPRKTVGLNGELAQLYGELILYKLQNPDRHWEARNLHGGRVDTANLRVLEDLWARLDNFDANHDNEGWPDIGDVYRGYYDRHGGKADAARIADEVFAKYYPNGPY